MPRPHWTPYELEHIDYPPEILWIDKVIEIVIAIPFVIITIVLFVVITRAIVLAF